MRHGSDMLNSYATDLHQWGRRQAFKEMADNGDGKLVMPDVFVDENTRDWTWPGQQ